MNIKLINSEYVTVEDMKFLQELDKYEFPERVYNVYKSTTNNKDISYEDARKKIIRDILLAEELPKKESIKHKRVFSFGNLLIQLNEEEHSICYIKNYKSYIDKNKKAALNEIMEIEDNTYSKNLFIGDLVKLKNNTIGIGKDKEFIENAIKEDWIFLITGIDDQSLDYIIQPIYLNEDFIITQLGSELLVLYDEIEQVKLSREKLFNILKK